MYFDLFLISVVLVAVYLGPLIILRHPPGQRGFGWLLVADGVAAGVALAGRWQGAGQNADLLGFVAIGAACILLVVPPILRDLTQRAMRRGHVRLAHRLLGAHELLQPGMGAAANRHMVEAVIAIRAGQVEEAVATLETTRATTDDEYTRYHVGERILLTYLVARKWREAIDTYEREFTVDTISAQLAIEVIRAYCELGERDKGAELLRTMEDSPLATEPAATLLIGRARLVFLAFAGRPREVETLLSDDGPMPDLPEASKHFWSGIAHLHAGDRPAARTRLQAAHELSDSDPLTHAYTARVVAAIDEPGVAGPHELSASVTELADRLVDPVAAMKPPPRQATPQISGVSPRQVPVTTAMLAGNVIAFLLVFWTFGSTGDPGALVLSGANVKSAVAAGEYWRLCTCMFLHVGFIHLLLNAYGLWLLGKLIEQIYGSGRALVVYVGTGVVGSLSSLLFSGPTMSAGASGAVLGVLGALIAELSLARSTYPQRWRKMLLGNLVFITVAMVAIGFFYEAIDQAAHVGGLVAGAVLGALLSPHSPLSAAPLTRWLARVAIVVSGLILAYSAIALMGSDYTHTMARYGQIEHRTHTGLAFVIPATWQVETSGLPADRPELSRLADPYVITVFDIEVHDIVESADRASQELDLTALLDKVRAREERQVKGSQRRPDNARMPLPAPWRSSELLLRQDDTGGLQEFRLIFFARRVDQQVWLGTLLIPDKLTDAMRPSIDRLLRSMRRI